MTIKKKTTRAKSNKKIVAKKAVAKGLDLRLLKKTIKEISGLLAGHGGGVELIEVKGRTVKVRLTGGCIGCPMAQMTLRHGVERRLKQALPEIESVEAA